MTRKCRLSWLVLILAVAVVPPAFADSYHAYSQRGIPPASDLFTWCDTPPCDVSQPVVCDTPEGGNSLRVNTNAWGGWGVFLQQPEDLSAFESGDIRFFVKSPFDLKVEFQCLEGEPASPQTYTKFISAHGWDGTATWQEIAIPVCEFFPDDICRPECLAQVKAPFMSTIADLPFFNTFSVDYVRWHKTSSNSGASSVQVDGRKLTVDGEPFVVNGMAYAPIGICENWQAGWGDRPDRYLVDFPLIAASGSNAVRLYAPILSKAMLDAAWAEGLYVIPTFGLDGVQLDCDAGKDYMRDRLVEMVTEWKDHPAILFWLIGNEFNRTLSIPDLCQNWYPQLDALAQAAHEAEGTSFHPVGTANADTSGMADICMAGCSDDTSLPNLDLWAVQIYRGCSFQTAFSEYQKPDCARPLVVTEFGVDAWDSLLVAENETMQASCLGDLLDEADQALAVRTPGGVSSGQVIFAWADEWWKVDCEGSGWCEHDTCGSYSNPSYPDPAINEEWWGVVSLESQDPDARGLRTAYDRVSEAWQLSAVCDLQVVSHNSTNGDTDLSFGPAAGSTDHTLYYGPLSAVSTYGYSGSVTGLGATGSSSVTLPPGSLFWVVAARNNGAEGCYGKDDAGNERPCYPGPGSCNLAQAVNRSCECP